jgi:hypothetical protein
MSQGSGCDAPRSGVLVWMQGGRGEVLSTARPSVRELAGMPAALYERLGTIEHHFKMR